MTDNKGQEPSSRRRVRAVASRLVALYKGCALLSFNTLVVYVLLNLALGIIFWIKDLSRTRLDDIDVTMTYSPDLLDKVYPGFNRQEWQQIIVENWARPYVYSDFTHFQECPFTGKYVNVTDTGYRKSTGQGPWPPASENVNVFVFGGSTTFGYGQPDDQTVPSFLQQALARHAKNRVCVYNFGVAWYYSTQERICFEKLLLQGHVPNIAIFIDGVNDAYCADNKPAFSRQLAVAFEQMSGFADSQSPGRANAAKSFWRSVMDVTFRRLPVGRAAKYVKRKLQLQDNGRPLAQTDLSEVIRGCNTYFTNKFLIEQLCQRFGVTPIFVWQPAPGYKYDLKYHLFVRPDEPPSQYQGTFYQTMRDLSHQRPTEPNFLWCADIQQDRTECLYCDGVHYNAAFSKVFAEFICQLCLERKLFDKYLDR